MGPTRQVVKASGVSLYCVNLKGSGSGQALNPKNAGVCDRISILCRPHQALRARTPQATRKGVKVSGVSLYCVNLNETLIKRPRQSGSILVSQFASFADQAEDG